MKVQLIRTRLARARFLLIAVIAAFAASVLLLSSTAPVHAAGALQCFDGTTDTASGDSGGAVYGGTCTLNAGGTGAILNNAVPVGAGDYSGVSFATSSLSGQSLGSVTDLSFTYTGTATAGSPRISLPIDTNGDGATDFYAFIGSFYCNNGAGLVDVLHDSTCAIFYTGSPAAGDTNWTAFVAAHPTWKIATSVPFIVADDAGLWTVGDVQLGAPPRILSSKDACKNGGWKGMHRTDGLTFKNQGDCIQYQNTGR